MIKEQIMIVPVNYINYNNGFTAATISTKDSYTRYDSIGIYKPIYEIQGNICFIRISVMLVIEHNGYFLVKSLKDKTVRPCMELGLHSYIKSYSGNHKAVYNQLEAITNQHNYKFIGNIRDLANKSVKSILGCVYYCDSNFAPEPSDLFTYEWLDTKTLMNNYSKFTSWSKPFIDMLVDNTFYNYI